MFKIGDEDVERVDLKGGPSDNAVVREAVRGGYLPPPARNDVLPPPAVATTLRDMAFDLDWDDPRIAERIEAIDLLRTKKKEDMRTARCDYECVINDRHEILKGERYFPVQPGGESRQACDLCWAEANG